MAKKILWVVMLVLAAALVSSCVTYRPVDVTNTMAAQINEIKFYTPKDGEEIKTGYVDRTGSFRSDLNQFEGGVWYTNHKDKIVSVEAVKEASNYFVFATYKDKWRIEYVD
jgi:hypothetical protein